MIVVVVVLVMVLMTIQPSYQLNVNAVPTNAISHKSRLRKGKFNLVNIVNNLNNLVNAVNTVNPINFVNFANLDKPYQLYQGDCLSILLQLPSNSVDAVITDPPYSSGGQSSAARALPPSKKYVQGGVKIIRPDFYGDNKDQRSYLYWCALWLSECFRIAKPGSPIAAFSDWRQLPITTDAIQAGGWVYRGVAVWDKTEGTRPQPGRFGNQCEYLCWGSKGEFPLRRHVPVVSGFHLQLVKPQDNLHMTGKPLELLEY